MWMGDCPVVLNTIDRCPWLDIRGMYSEMEVSYVWRGGDWGMVKVHRWIARACGRLHYICEIPAQIS